jgi:hypothetical protein
MRKTQQNFEEGDFVRFITNTYDSEHPRFLGIIIEQMYQYPEYRYKIMWFDETFDSLAISYHESWMQQNVFNLTLPKS